MNLTWETLEGLVKHNGPLTGALPGPIASFDKRWPLELESWPGLEAQLAALADDHDTEKVDYFDATAATNGAAADGSANMNGVAQQVANDDGMDEISVRHSPRILGKLLTMVTVIA